LETITVVNEKTGEPDIYQLPRTMWGIERILGDNVGYLLGFKNRKIAEQEAKKQNDAVIQVTDRLAKILSKVSYAIFSGSKEREFLNTFVLFKTDNFNKLTNGIELEKSIKKHLKRNPRR